MKILIVSDIHGRGYLLSDLEIIESHIPFYRDRNSQNNNCCNIEFYLLRRYHFLYRALGKLESDEKDEQRHYKAGYIFYSSMSERVIFIRLLT